MASQLPGARAAIADNQGLPTPEFYRFLLGLQRLSAGSATSADIAALQTQIAAIQAEIDGLPQSSGYPTLQVTAPLTSSGLLQNGFAKLGVKTLNSVVINGNALQLSGDASAPGNTYFYGTGLTGAKGWQALSGVLHASANVAVTFGADGTATFDLKPLTDSGAGTFKLITRDSYGRLAGTKAGTTSDVPEGTNLYFTAARVLATVLSGLSTATNAVITAADSVLVALGKLQAQITANNSASVHLAGAETITGAKTFNAAITGNDANSLYHRKNNQVADYTLTAADVGTYIGIFAPLTVTIPPNVFSVNGPSGAAICGVVRFVQNSTASNIVTLSPGSGVVLQGPTATTGPNQILEVINLSLNGWVTHLYT